MRSLLIVFLLSLTLSSASFGQTKTEIPIELLPSGHILLKAKVEGVEGSFIFDTGAGLTLVTKKFFDKLQHTKREDGGYTGFRATGERMDIDLYLVNNFELGTYKKPVEEITFLDVNLGGIDGIISLKLLETQPFTIDFEKKLLRLESVKTLTEIKKKSKKINVQLEQSRERSLTLFSYFRINDTLSLQLSLDAGAGKDVYRINAKYLKALQVDVNDTIRVKKYEKASELNNAFRSVIYTTQLNKLASIDQPAIKKENFPVQFVDGLIYDGIIWISWLGKSISFDLKEKALFVQQ